MTTPTPADQLRAAQSALYEALTTGVRHAQIRQHLIDQHHEAVAATVARQLLGATTCGCPHPADEHSVYGCAEDCACEWMPPKPPAAPPAPADRADLPDRLQAVLTERYTALGNPGSEMRYNEQAPDGWPASHPVGPNMVAEVLRELLTDEPAPADRAAEVEDLRAELDKLIRWHKEDGAQAVKAATTITRLRAERAELIRQRDQIAMDTIKALPAPADRAAILTELEARYRGHARDSVHPILRAAYAAVANDLSHLADEPAPADRAAALTEAERTMLTYALDQAQKHIWTLEGFTDEDQAAVTSLRRLAGEAAAGAQQTAPAVVDAQSLRCSLAILRRPHDPHLWEPQPGMDPVRCPGTPPATSAVPEERQSASAPCTTPCIACMTGEPHTPAVPKEQPVVAHRIYGHGDLRCIRCIPAPRGDIWTPVTADDLPDGGLCAACGTDVLIPAVPEERP